VDKPAGGKQLLQHGFRGWSRRRDCVKQVKAVPIHFFADGLPAKEQKLGLALGQNWLLHLL